MSISYNQPIEGITKLRLVEGQAHDRLSIWIEHGLSGELVLPLGWGARLARMFSKDSGDDSNDAMRTHWGGENVGTVVTDNAHLPDRAILISEYGEVLTAGEVRARAGARRKDGMPTELFGYEAGK